MSKKNSKLGTPSIANRKARHLYHLLDFFEAGICLNGGEVKSVRAGKVNFVDSHVDFSKGEAILHDLHIAPYTNAGYAVQEADRPRKLLLHKREILRLAAQVAQKGLTVVPTSLYFKHGLVKIEIALAKGKKLYDQRETLKQRAIERDRQMDF